MPPLLYELTTFGQRESVPAILAFSTKSENCTEIPYTFSCVFVMWHIIVTKCLLQAHSGEEGSTGKYQHEVEGVPKGAARRNSRDQMLVFSCTPKSS